MPANLPAERGVNVEELNRWFDEYTSTPVGSLVLFALVFLARVSLDRWDRRRKAKKAPKRKGKARV